MFFQVLWEALVDFKIRKINTTFPTTKLADHKGFTAHSGFLCFVSCAPHQKQWKKLNFYYFFLRNIFEIEL